VTVPGATGLDLTGDGAEKIESDLLSMHMESAYVLPIPAIILCLNWGGSPIPA